MESREALLLELKSKLSEELRKEKSDNNVILLLSNEIAKLDEEQVRFSVDAGIINRLGKELVGRHETAVSELVKNAYDADATEVELIFENAWQKGGTLYIEDNGMGMTREQLINGFMRLSSADKIHNPISTRYDRVRAGKKGIGRFATQRLGEKLTIITQTLESEQALKVSIIWDSFKIDKELQLITNQIEVIPKIKDEGTTLIIEGLREGWSDAMIKRVYRYTSELLQPFPLSIKRKKREENRTDPGFKSSYFRRQDGKLEPKIDDEAFFQHALAEIEGYVMEDGQGCWTLKSKKIDLPDDIFLIGKDRNIEKSKFKLIRDIYFKCYYFIYDSKLIPSKTLSFIRGIGNERGGIRLYRNGIRVASFGEKYNDWLGFDESVRRRNYLFPHGNNNFFGFVEVTDELGTAFEETSSREALLENESYIELVDFVYTSIISALIKIAEIRDRKASTGQRDYEKKDDATAPEKKVDNAIEKLSNIVKSSQSGNKSETLNESSTVTNENAFEIVRQLTEARIEEKAEKEEEKQRLLEENNMLRILGGLGLVIGEFVHEVNRFLPAFDADITFLRKAVSDMVARERVNRLDENLKGFTTFTSYFYETISRNVLRELEPIELRDIVYAFEVVIKEDIKNSGYIFHKPVFEDYDLWTVPMHKSEWASILFNFYINSKKAIKRAGAKGEVFIRAGREGDKVFEVV